MVSLSLLNNEHRRQFEGCSTVSPYGKVDDKSLLLQHRMLYDMSETVGA